MMQLNRPEAYETVTELELMERLLPLDDRLILELGCGGAWTIRQLAQRHPGSRFVATEVDARQHAKNLQLELPNVEFRLEGAEKISQPDDSIDIVWMLKSLHHVPPDLMSKAMQEIRRVLKPGGLVWFSEPVYFGPFNALMSRIHDEKIVRQQAFTAVREQVDSGAMQLVEERFFQVPGVFESWEQFESRFLQVTHTKLDIEERRYTRIRTAFMAHMGEDGARFLKPHRLDLLRKPPLEGEIYYLDN